MTTARFGGPDVADRVALLLEAVGDAPDRAARMVCVLVLASPGWRRRTALETFSGTMDGSVATEPRGAVVSATTRSSCCPAAAPPPSCPMREGRISHRGRAVQAAMPRLRELLAAARGGLDR